MIYCMSDLHGERDLFERMLEQIGFSEEDHLYIIGDVIDRGRGGVAMLEQIMDSPNMTMLLGNHEKMCLAVLGPRHALGGRELWRQNGGGSTYRDLIYRRTPPGALPHPPLPGRTSGPPGSDRERPGLPSDPRLSRGRP